LSKRIIIGKHPLLPECDIAEMKQKQAAGVIADKTMK
jgi:hypothetical protein